MRSDAPRTASLILPTRNRLFQLRYALAAIEHQNAPAAAYEVIVVDDDSGDGTSDWLAAYRPPYALRTLRNDRQLGRGMSRNRGMDAASGDIVVFLDGDMICPPSFVSAHLRLHAELDGAETCVSGYPWCWRTVATWSFDLPPQPLLDLALLARWEEFERWAGGPLGDPRMPAAVVPPDAAPFLWCVAAACSLDRSLGLEVGGFDRRFQGYGWEDWELGYRLNRRGVRFIAHPDASAFHQAHPPTERGSFDWTRNLALFLELHPDFEVALMFRCVPGTDGRYERLYAAYHRLARVAPALAEALREVAVDEAWARYQQRPTAVRGWAFWAARWGAERAGRILWEQLAAMSDGVTRPLVPLFRELTG